MEIPNFDDKDLVIVGAILLTGIVIFVLPSEEVAKIVPVALAGLFGLGKGKPTNGNGGTQ